MTEDVKAIADDLAGYDEDALIELLGVRAKSIESNPAIAGQFAPEAKYDGKVMGPLDSIRALGLRILKEWNKQLFGIVCGGAADGAADRTKILNALSLGEGAAIAAIIPVLTALGLAPALAAVVAAIVVKRFLGTAIDTICEAWKEQIG